jgi:hypothetical protein
VGESGGGAAEDAAVRRADRAIGLPEQGSGQAVAV